MVNSAGWFYWALLSAMFAALTGIFAKVGIQGVDSDLATLIRTAIIIVVLSAFVAYTGNGPTPWSYHPRHGFSSGCPAWRQGHRGSATSAHSRLAMHPRLRQWINSVLSWWRYLRRLWANARH
jgi:transporter family protein